MIETGSRAEVDTPRFKQHVRGGHRARWLATVDEAYDVMQQCIDAATRSVCLETYLLREEGPATVLAEALVRACARGLRVRMLVDAFGAEGVPPDFYDKLRTAGVQIAIFNPQRLLRRAFRNHRKLLVCDEQHAIVGGFNIAPEYAGDGVTHGWCDTGVHVEGPVALALARSFDAMFDLAPFTPRALRRFRRVARAGFAHDLPADSPLTLLLSGPGLPPRMLRRSLRRDLAAAQRVSIASAYFLPGLRIRRLMYRVVRRGGRVRLLLAGQSDVPVARLAAEHLYSRLLRRRVRILEYQPQVLHAKLMITDDVVNVGSCNLDRRSLHINYELLLRFDWPQLAADAQAWYGQALNHSKQVNRRRWLASRGWFRRVLSRLAYTLLARLDPLVARRGFKAIK